MAGNYFKTMRTKEQIKEFILINRHLMTVQEMADELGIPHQNVQSFLTHRKLTALKITDRHKDFILNNKDMTIEEVAEVLNMGYDNVRKLNIQLGEPLMTNKQRELKYDNPDSKEILPKAVGDYTVEQEAGLYEVLIEIVKGYTPEQKQRFAERFFR